MTKDNNPSGDKVKRLYNAVEDVMSRTGDGGHNLSAYCRKAQTIVNYFISAAGLDDIEDLINENRIISISDSDRTVLDEIYADLNKIENSIDEKMDAVEFLENELETDGSGESCSLSMKDLFDDYNVLVDLKRKLDMSISLIGLTTNLLGVVDNMSKLKESIRDGSYRRMMQEKARDEVKQEMMLYGGPRKEEPKSGKKIEVSIYG